MVEDACRVISSALHIEFEVQMLGRSPAGSSHDAYHLSGAHLLASLHQIFRHVRIERPYAIGMLYLYAVAIAGEGSAAQHLALEGGKNLVRRICLEVYTRVVAPSAIRAYHLCPGQRIRPAVVGYLREVDGDR